MLLFAKDIATGSRLFTTFPKAGAPKATVSTCEREMNKRTGILIMRKQSRQPGSIPSAEPERLEMPAVLFDLDGTLVDSNYQHVDAWSEGLLEAVHCDSEVEDSSPRRHEWKIHVAGVTRNWDFPANRFQCCLVIVIARSALR